MKIKLLYSQLIVKERNIMIGQLSIQCIFFQIISFFFQFSGYLFRCKGIYSFCFWSDNYCWITLGFYFLSNTVTVANG